MRALVTGAAGFVGSHLVDRLLADGWEVLGIDNYAAGCPDNLQDATCQQRFAGVVADVCHVGPGLFEGTHTVFHQAAAKKRASGTDPRHDLLVNALGTFRVLDCAAKAGVHRFIYASTGSVYGLGQKKVGAPLVPVSFYGVSKSAAEKYVRLFADQMDTTILRYFHVYGPRQNSRPDLGGVVSIFLRRLLEGKPPIIHGDGQQTHSFTWVDDAVEANLIAGPGTFNVASGVETSIERLAAMCRSVAPGPEPIYESWQEIEIGRFEVDNSGLDIEWLPLADGLRATAEWLRRALDADAA